MLVLPTKLTHDDAPACMRMLQQGLKGQADTSTVVDASAAIRPSMPRALISCANWVR